MVVAEQVLDAVLVHRREEVQELEDTQVHCQDAVVGASSHCPNVDPCWVSACDSLSDVDSIQHCLGSGKADCRSNRRHSSVAGAVVGHRLMDVGAVHHSLPMLLAFVAICGSLLAKLHTSKASPGSIVRLCSEKAEELLVLGVVRLQGAQDRQKLVPGKCKMCFPMEEPKSSRLRSPSPKSSSSRRSGRSDHLEGLSNVLDEEQRTLSKRSARSSRTPQSA